MFFLRHKFSPVRHAVIADCQKLRVNVGFGAKCSGINFLKEFTQMGVVLKSLLMQTPKDPTRHSYFFPYFIVFETRLSVEDDCKDYCPSVNGNSLSGWNLQKFSGTLLPLYVGQITTRLRHGASFWIHSTLNNPVARNG